jgi:hypothetical protein
MLEMNNCIHIREQISRKNQKGPPFGLKIAGNGFKRRGHRIQRFNMWSTEAARVWYGLSTDSLSTPSLSTPSLSTDRFIDRPFY